MTVNEFKAWIDGFSAAINGAPTLEQWDTIKAKLAMVEGNIASMNWGKLYGAGPIRNDEPDIYDRKPLWSGSART